MRRRKPSRKPLQNQSPEGPRITPRLVSAHQVRHGDPAEISSPRMKCECPGSGTPPTPTTRTPPMTVSLPHCPLRMRTQLLSPPHASAPHGQGKCLRAGHGRPAGEPMDTPSASFQNSMGRRRAPTCTFSTKKIREHRVKSEKTQVPELLRGNHCSERKSCH